LRSLPIARLERALAFTPAAIISDANVCLHSYKLAGSHSQRR
jgi:hypothetical protein